MNTITNFISPAAKAIAAFITPLLAALVALLIERTGVDLPFDPSAFEAFATAAVTAFLVWLIANRQPRSEGESAFVDRGHYDIAGLIVITAVAVLVVVVYHFAVAT